jgi:hypothetical protein
MIPGERDRYSVRFRIVGHDTGTMSYLNAHRTPTSATCCHPALRGS